MQNENTGNSNVMIINLRDLFFYLLKKWPVLLAAFVIGGVVGGVLSYKEMKTDDFAALEAQVQALNDSDLNQENIKQYIDYKALYDQQVAYEAESYRMKLDPNAVWSGNLTYFVSCTSDTIDAIGATYNNVLNIEDRQKQLLAASGLECTEQAFGELIKISFEAFSAQYQLNGEYDSPMDRSGNITISVWAPDEASCGKIVDGLKGIIETESDKVAALYPENYSLSLVADRVQFGRNDILATAQKDAVSLRKTYLAETTAAKNSLTADEKAYCDYYFMDKDAAAPVKGFSKMKPVIGAVAAAFVLAVILVVCYLFSGKVKTKEDLQESFGLPILAYLFGTGKKAAGLTKLFKAWEETKLPAVNDTEYVGKVLSAKTFDKALLVADLSDPSIKAIAEQILQEDKRLSCLGLLEKDGEAVKALQTCDTVLLLTCFWKTSKAEVRRELEIIRNNGKTVIGAVAVRGK